MKMIKLNLKKKMNHKNKDKKGKDVASKKKVKKI